MRYLSVAVLATGAAMLLLAGCASSPPPAAPKPVSEMTPAERCENLLRLMGNPWLEPFQKAAVYEKARNDGCMGTPQSQTVVVR